jgi:hypothetical protein
MDDPPGISPPMRALDADWSPSRQDGVLMHAHGVRGPHSSMGAQPTGDDAAGAHE